MIGLNDDRHVMTIAGSRAGKGVSLIVPNLIFYEGSALAVDPKGENATITAGRRGKAPPWRGTSLGQDCNHGILESSESKTTTRSTSFYLYLNLTLLWPSSRNTRTSMTTR